jgi:uncharacterized integral membrane protein
MKILMIILILLAAAFIVLFFVENMDPVQIYLPILKGRSVGLIYIILGSYLAGILTACAVAGAIGARIGKRRRIEALNEGQEELFDEE